MGTTPAPWRDAGVAGAIVSDDPATVARETKRRGADHIAFYTGPLVCESAEAADRRLIVQMRREWEAQHALETAMREFLHHVEHPVARRIIRTLLDELEAARNQT